MTEFLGYYLCFWLVGGAMDTAFTWEIDSLLGPYESQEECQRNSNLGTSECFVQVLARLRE